MIKILDCTLRDGGYVNNWRFERSTVKSIVQSLVDSGIQIIELGYLDKKRSSADSFAFEKGSDFLGIVKEINHSAHHPIFCVMADVGKFSSSQLPECSKESISGIRLAFHKKDLDLAVKEAEKIIKKGYKVFVQPMVVTAYSESELRELINKFNALNVFAVYIVDSFGLLLGDEFKRIFDFFHSHLRSKIALGYHGHNNFQMAYANAMEIATELQGKRDLFIDTSIFGMGRGAGNLNTELFVNFLNSKYAGNYNVMPLLECVDNYLESIYRENGWGYSLAYFLSAAMNCHPNYANFLINKKTITVVEVQKLLAMIPEEKKRLYDQAYIEKRYLEFRSVSKTQINAPDSVLKGRNIMLIASGASVNNNIDKLNNRVRKDNALVVAVNHLPANMRPDYAFFSNQKRYNEFKYKLKASNLIITSNIELDPEHIGCYVVDYRILLESTSCRSENVAIIFMSLLVKLNIKKVALAGLDGFRTNPDEDYSYHELNRQTDKGYIETQNKNIASALKELESRISIEFLTPSMFEGLCK